MALVRWAQGRLYSLSDALLDSQGAADQSVRQIRLFPASSCCCCCWYGWCTG
jgi:hypothetical protein